MRLIRIVLATVAIGIAIVWSITSKDHGYASAFVILTAVNGALWIVAWGDAD